MIDTEAAASWAHFAAARHSEFRSVVNALVARAPVMQNRPFAMSPTPVLVAQEQLDAHCRAVEDYVRLLGRIIKLYRSEPVVRRWYALGTAVERRVGRSPDGPGGTAGPWICRLDGYVRSGSGRLAVLENNADAPAGTVFTPRVNRLGTQVVAELGGRHGWEVSDRTFTDDRLFPDALVAATTEQGAPAVVVLQVEGRASRECTEIVRMLCERGLDAFVADPRSAQLSRGRARFGGRPADVCWNKINMTEWLELQQADDAAERWARVTGGSHLVLLNPEGARHVAENKLSLALPFDPELGALLQPAERDLAHRLLPWAAKVTDTAVDEHGESLVAALLREPDEWVLKQPYDIRGDGVVVGYAADEAQWRTAVHAAVATGHLAQRRVRPAGHPVPDPDTGDLVNMTFSLDSYVLDGRFVGFGSKAGTGPKVNVFQGGRKLPVLVRNGGSER